MFRHKSRSKQNGSRKAARSSVHESMESHDTGIYLNTNSTESSGVHRHHCNAELFSSDTISPVCEPSEISTPVDGNAPHNEVWQDVRRRTSFEKTSTWLLQQDTGRASTMKEADVGLERATLSNICVDSKSSDLRLSSTVSASHSAPVLSENVVMSEDDRGMARSSTTVVASMPSEQAFVESHSPSGISVPASHNSLRQKTRQLRFSCAVAAVEDCTDSKDSEVNGSHTFPFNSALNVGEEADGEQLVIDCTHNSVEELSAEDGASLANSNTSLSDTCNSSFKSSTEDLANRDISFSNENSMPAASSAAEITPRVSSLHPHHSPGLRHRKRRVANDNQYGLSPARQCERVRQDEAGEEDGGVDKNCQECHSLVLESGGGMRESADAAAAAVGELPRSAVSSDDDDDNVPHISPSKCRLLHPRHARRPCSARTARSNEKFSSHNAAADVSLKDRVVRIEGRRSNARMMDVRLLESTGISSADSDGEAARLSAAKSPSTPKASKAVV